MEDDDEYDRLGEHGGMSFGGGGGGVPPGALFVAAAQPDVVRAAQKDEYFASQFRDEWRELAAVVLGRQARLWQHEVELVADLLFYGSTTLLGRPTLGEEYCDLQQLTPSGMLPSWRRRCLLVGLQVVVPFAYRKVRRLGRRVVINEGASRLRYMTQVAWNHLVSAVLQSDSTIDTLQRLHLALFYLAGRYLEVAKRLSGVRYVFLRRLDYERPGYQLLGILIMIQLCVSAILFLKSQLQKQQQQDTTTTTTTSTTTTTTNDDDDSKGDDCQWEDDDDDAPNCSLCLCPREEPTVTECGHVFCWGCIAECCTAKEECPLCRQPATVQQLVRLSQFK